MKVLLCVVLGLIIFAEGEDVREKIKSVQRRGTYYAKQTPDEDSRYQASPNDFAIMRAPGPGNDYHNHYHHYHGGPSDFHHHHHHDDYPSSSPRDDEGLGDDGFDYDAVNYTGLPLDFAKSVNQYIVSDLLLNYIDDAPENFDTPSVSSRLGEVDANESERNSAKMARPAKCMPELTTVKIAESKDPNVFYVPECTRIERCGGCCSHVLLACQPTETETVTYSVIKTEYMGGQKLKYVGKEPILVEKHTKCECGCKIKAKDCNSYQVYEESDCRCMCKNLDEEKKCYKSYHQKKLWNPDICACQCREVTPCTTNFQFDYNECRCIQSQVKRRYVLSESIKEQPEPLPEE